MTRLSVKELQEKASEAISQVTSNGERIVLSQSGKDIAALISVEDLADYERLLKEEEDRLDLESARKALAEPGPNIALEDVRKRLGL